MQIIFWGSLLLIAYPYAIYPMLLAAWGALRPRPVRRGDFEPKVSVIVPAYNEAGVIAATLDALLAQDYPVARMQIIVVSDQSDDGTDDIVQGYAGRGVTLLRQPTRGGKALGLNAAMRLATGVIVVFCDANSRFERSAIRHLAANFADPEVGYVTGSLRMDSEGDTLNGGGMSAYMGHEEQLRLAETRVGSVIGVNGGNDAIRRELYSDIPRELITDFVLPLRVIAAGFRVVFDPAVQSRERANAELKSEFSMRVRVALRSLQGLLHMRRLLNPLRHPATAFCLFSHKVVRYLAFVFLATAALSNAALAVSGPFSGFYGVLFAGHVLCYALSFCGMAGWGGARLKALTTAPAYLLMSYAAFAVASWRFLRGQSMATWKPRAG